MQRFITCITFTACLYLPGSVYAIDFGGQNTSDDTSFIRSTLKNGQTAAAQPGMTFGNKQPRRIDFDFDGNRAWLNSKGEWYIEGYVQHTRLRCANYQLSIRFGKSKQGCLNPQWATDFQNASNIKQCNSATMKHKGGGNFNLQNSLDDITCAEIKLDCFGVCDGK